MFLEVWSVISELDFQCTNQLKKLSLSVLHGFT